MNMEQHLAAVVSHLRTCSDAEAESSAKRWLDLLRSWIVAHDGEPALTLLDANGYSGSISERGSLYGLCPHHMVPYHGSYQLSFQPQKHMLGLSCIGRAVDHFSRRARLQENLTQEIGEFFFCHLRPESLEFRIEARHLCKEMQHLNYGTEPFVTVWKKQGQ